MLIISTISSSYSSNPSQKDKYTRVQDYINNRICYPECNKGDEVNGIVLVEYSINTDGSLNLSGINASNQLLKDYVKNQFCKIEIKDTSFAEDTSFICKYVFVDEDNLDNIDVFQLDENLNTGVDYLAKK